MAELEVRFCRVTLRPPSCRKGCRIEERQLGTVDRLEACLAIDPVVA